MTMGARRQSMSRALPGKTNAASSEAVQPTRPDAPRLVRKTVIDFTTLHMPEDVRLALAEAFWGHYGVQSADTIKAHWFHVRTFDRFVHESGAVKGLADVHRGVLVRYIEWLNVQCRLDGQPRSKVSRAAPYTALRKLLQWLARCRPGTIAAIDYPFSPFPWRDRESQPHDKIATHQLRAILEACEADIAQNRLIREAAAAAPQEGADGSLDTVAGLLQYIDRHFDGIVPTWRDLSHPGEGKVRAALARFGSARQVEPCLYPRSESLLPYYLAILIHTAGNPEPILDLQHDCLQLLPLLDDRVTLVWRKGRTPRLQRRTFKIAAAFEPPALVRDILQWTERLRPFAPATLRGHLFLFKRKGLHAVTALSASTVKYALKLFCARHSLPAFSLASIRPSVLSAFYRTSGDLRQVRAVANHVRLATTVRYVEAPEVQAQHRMRVAALQSAFVGHIVKHQTRRNAADVVGPPEARRAPSPAQAVSLFGFGCKDPFAGTAPGTRSGELCMNFMGCFTCPNAIIAPDPSTVARLLQARDHLRAAAATLHPARWQVVYAPQLRILEEDILARFAAREIAAAVPLLAQLPPLPELR
jgi:hypothetical protein